LIKKRTASSMPYAAARIRGSTLNTIRTPRRAHCRSLETSPSTQHWMIASCCSSVGSVTREAVLAVGAGSVLEEEVLVVAKVLLLRCCCCCLKNQSHMRL
jgi:hypothetical protein